MNEQSFRLQSGSFIIRDYRPADYPAVAALWEATGLGGSDRGDSRAVVEHSLTLGGRLLLVECKEHAHAFPVKQQTGARENVMSGSAASHGHSLQLIATSWMTCDGRRLHLHHFGVMPAWQRQGIGRMLTHASVAYARDKGLQIKLEVHRDNAAAIALYKSCGFGYLGDYDVYIIRNTGNASV